MQSEINYLEHTKLLCEDFDMSIIHTTPIPNQKQEPNSSGNIMHDIPGRLLQNG